MATGKLFSLCFLSLFYCFLSLSLSDLEKNIDLQVQMDNLKKELAEKDQLIMQAR